MNSKNQKLFSLFERKFYEFCSRCDLEKDLDGEKGLRRFSRNLIYLWAIYDFIFELKTY